MAKQIFVMRLKAELKKSSHFSESFSLIQERMEMLWNPRIPMMIRAYFEDMRLVLAGLREWANPDASIWIVVSTSAYAGVEIPVDLIIADIGSQTGWYLREVSAIRYLRRVPVQQWSKLSEAAREKKTKKQQIYEGPYLRESVVILDAKPA